MFSHIYKKKLETAGESGLWATVYFTDAAFQFDPIDNRPQFKSVAIEEIKRKREQFELKQHLGQRGIMDIYYERMKTGYYDCKYIDSVSVHYLPSSKLLEVSPIFMGWYTTIPLANIEACITEKENKLAQYKTMSKNIDIDEYWLFISIPPGAGCSLDSFEMPPISSSYERIYITDFAQVLQLI